MPVKKTILGRRVLRSRTPAGLAQEVFALLSVYQILRTAIADATDTVPGADPDRVSFTIALQTARNQVIQAANVLADTTSPTDQLHSKPVRWHPAAEPVSRQAGPSPTSLSFSNQAR